jgi:hypothetical protein
MSLQYFFTNAANFNQNISTWNVLNDGPNQSQYPHGMNFLNSENVQPSETANLSNITYDVHINISNAHTINVNNNDHIVRSFNVDNIDYSYANHECSICLTDINENIVKTICEHYFCKSCVDKWLSEHYNCPNCRNNLLSS